MSSKFKPAISSEQSTHKSKGYFDNFWTIIDISQVYLIEKLNSLSDHALFIVILKIGSQVKRSIPYKTKLSSLKLTSGRLLMVKRHNKHSKRGGFLSKPQKSTIVKMIPEKKQYNSIIQILEAHARIVIHQIMPEL